MEKSNKKIIWITTAIITTILILWIIIPHIKEAKVKAEYESNIQTLRETPAAEYCKNNWWILEIKTDESNNIYWICKFKDWSACEITEYFRWECLSSSEESENEEQYCSDSSDCENNESEEDEEYESLSSRIDDMNNIEYEDEENLDEEVLDGDNLDEFDIDSLYEYYENEFNNTWDRNREQLTWNLEEEILDFEHKKNNENQTLSTCEKIHWNIVDGKCFLSNWIEIVF